MTEYRIDKIEYSGNTYLFDQAPIRSKTFTNVIGTENNWANATFFFGSIKPASWNTTWRIQYKINVYVPNHTNYCQEALVTVSGKQGDLRAYASFNTIGEYYVCYYHVLYRLKSDGFTNGYGHSLGTRFYSAYNPIDTDYKRTIEVDILETHNCTFDFYDSCLKYAEIPGTGSTNYNTYSEFDFVSNGLCETGDTSYVDDRIVYFSGKTSASKGIWAGSLFMEDGNRTYQNICAASDGTITSSNRTTATTKVANTSGFRVGSKVYYSSTNYNPNTNISGWGVVFTQYGSLFDSRYCFNTSLTAGSLTAYSQIYLVGTINATDGLFYLDTTWWTQTPNDTSKVYILVGACFDSTTSNCRMVLYENNPWLKWDGSKLVPFVQNAQTVNGHTVAKDVPSNAVFTDSDISTLSLASGSTAGTSLTYGGKFTLTAGTKTVSFTMPSTDNTDEKLKTVALTSGTAYYPILATGANAAANRQVDSTLGGIKYTSTAGTTSAVGSATLQLGNATASGTANNEQGKIEIYGTNAKKATISLAAPTADIALALPTSGGTIALTSDIPSNIVTGSGSTNRLAIWSDTNTLSSHYLSIGTSYNSSSDLYGKVKLYVGATGQIDWQGQLVFYSGNTSETITITPPSLATGSRIITLPDKTGTIALTDDIPTTVTDENVKSTAVTAATTNYIVGSTTSTTTTGGLSKHASGVLYTTADSGTSGYTQLRLGNTTATSSAGGKEGQIRLYGTTATYYVDLKAGAPSANRTITLPNKTGTIALTDDIPTVPSNIVNTITTTAGAHTTITSQKGNVSFKIPTTAAHVGAATSDHTHGNITNGGDITATAPTIASGDQIIINDNSASKITNGPTFDGSTTTKALTPKGTWETFLKSYTETDPTVPSWAKASTKPSYTASEVGALPDTTTIPSNTSDLNNDSGFITLSDVPNISSLIIVDTHTPTGYEFTSSQNRSITTNLQSHSGYTPYALKCVCTNKASIRIYNYYISSGTIVFEAINTTSSKVTGVNFNIQILWIKNTILGS